MEMHVENPTPKGCYMSKCPECVIGAVCCGQNGCCPCIPWCDSEVTTFNPKCCHSPPCVCCGATCLRSLYLATCCFCNDPQIDCYVLSFLERDCEYTCTRICFDIFACCIPKNIYHKYSK